MIAQSAWPRMLVISRLCLHLKLLFTNITLSTAWSRMCMRTPFLGRPSQGGCHITWRACTAKDHGEDTDRDDPSFLRCSSAPRCHFMRGDYSKDPWHIPALWKIFWQPVSTIPTVGMVPDEALVQLLPRTGCYRNHTIAHTICLMKVCW